MTSNDATVSLLHATYHRPGGPLPVAQAWIEAADSPELIDYVVAMDDDDTIAIAVTAGQPRSVLPRSERVTAVRNWNAAAKLATGALLVVIADDLFPPDGWDTRLRQITAQLDPLQISFAVKVWDSDLPGVKLRHPVISRHFYERFGLFDPAYTGVYCDDDLTATAFWRASIIDGRAIRLDHRHPMTSAEVAGTRSHERVNATTEYTAGRMVYEDKWRWRQRFPLERHGRIASEGSTVAMLSPLRRRLRLLGTYADLTLWAIARCAAYLRNPGAAYRRLRTQLARANH